MSNFGEKLNAFVLHRHPQGCSSEQIKSLTDQTVGDLPESYLEFMKVAGNGVDGFLQGSDFTIKDLDGVRDAADELLLEAGLNRLPSNAFVFAMHQGYQFYFFQSGVVYYFREGNSCVERRFDSFEDFFDFVVQCIRQR